MRDRLTSLLETPFSDEEEKAKEESGWLSNAIRGIEEYFKKKQENQINERFNPKFNVREEFALWVREQFPELREYEDKTGSYQALEQRKDEVIRVAKQAYDHAVNTSRDCVVNYYYQLWKQLNDCSHDSFPFVLNQFVIWTERVAANIGKDSHYGTKLNGERVIK